MNHSIMSDEDSRPECKYGSLCYRKNPDHLKQFKHPGKRKSDEPQKEAKKIRHEEDKANDGREQKLNTINESSEQKEEEPLEEKFLEDKPSKEKEDEPSEEEKEDRPSEETPSEEKDIEMVPESPQDSREAIKQKFLVDMPDDFFSFWEFCKTLKPDEPESALTDFGLLLVGPYDVLSGRLSRATTRRLRDFLCHWRYYYDPPEFQTVLKGDEDSGYHMGYFRDSPSELPSFVAANSAEKDCVLKQLGGNLFAGVNTYLSNELRKVDPMKKMKLTKLQTSLKKYAEEKDLSLSAQTPEMKKRTSRSVARSFHCAGVVVPYCKKTQVGYREIPESTGNLKKMFKNIVEAKSDKERQEKLDILQDEVLVNVHFANDEGDPGMGLELGLDMFSFGGEALHQTVLNTLTVSYDLLQREAFSKILQAHLQNRRKGSCLSIIPGDERSRK